jgi:predicted amidophosphoribosyltransferase
MCVRCDEASRIENLEKRRPRVVARWHYEAGPRELILRTKLRGDLDAAAVLAAGMVAGVHSTGLRATAITWVPGRTRDIRRRGFDHARVLAEGAGESLGLPCVPFLRRVGDPPDQTGLGAAARRRNLTGAFVASSRVTGRVAIVDDLVTTGSTLSVCAGALLAGGAVSVEGLVACLA